VLGYDKKNATVGAEKYAPQIRPDLLLSRLTDTMKVIKTHEATKAIISQRCRLKIQT